MILYEILFLFSFFHLRPLLHNTSKGIKNQTDNNSLEGPSNRELFIGQIFLYFFYLQMMFASLCFKMKMKRMQCLTERTIIVL